jgi:hypothetical protein
VDFINTAHRDLFDLMLPTAKHLVGTLKIKSSHTRGILVGFTAMLGGALAIWPDGGPDSPEQHIRAYKHDVCRDVTALRAAYREPSETDAGTLAQTLSDGIAGIVKAIQTAPRITAILH